MKIRMKVLLITLHLLSDHTCSVLVDPYNGKVHQTGNFDVSTSRKGHFLNMVITNITTIWASHSINRYKTSNNSANSLKTSICNKNIAYIMIHHTTSCASNSILWHSWHYAHNMIDHVHQHYIIQHHGHHRAFNHIITKFY